MRKGDIAPGNSLLGQVRPDTYSEPSIPKGTASKTTSGPMLATAAPTAWSRAAVWGKWGERRRSHRDWRHCSGDRAGKASKCGARSEG